MAEARLAFNLCSDNDPVEIVRFIHDSIKKTRGAVGMVVVYDSVKDFGKSLAWGI